MSSTDHETAPGVVDPRWEEELLAGQQAEGESGGLDADLAMIHLLRHAREPDPLSEAAFESIWSEVRAEVVPAPWWKRRWWTWAVPALAGAAVLAIVIVPPGDGGAVAQRETAPQADGEGSIAGNEEAGAGEGSEGPVRIASRSAQAELIEQQFAALAADGRAEVAGSVDQGRGRVRSALVDGAKEANR